MMSPGDVDVAQRMVFLNRKMAASSRGMCGEASLNIIRRHDFSVLLSVYNQDDACIFDGALNSIYRQTLIPSQVVIVIDGPISNELESVIGRYKEILNIDIIRLEFNVGLGPSLAIGINRCKYDLICRADADDINLPKRFKIQVDYMYSNPSVDVLGSDILEIYMNKARVRRSCKNVKLGARFFMRNPMNHQAVCYRKQSILNVGGYEDYPGFEDYCLWAKLLKNNYSIRNLDAILVHANAVGILERRSGDEYAEKEMYFYKKLKVDHHKYRILINVIMAARAALRKMPKKIITFAYFFVRGKR